MDKETARRVEDLELCARCGGRCCKEAPGRFAPEDFEGSCGFDIEKVRASVKDKRASFVVGFIKALSSPLAPIFMLKHRGKGKGVLEFFSSDTQCSVLTASGCPYSLDERPFECAGIVPSTEKCALPEGMHMEDFWAPWQDAMRELVSEYAGCDWAEEFDRQFTNKRIVSPFKREAQELTRKYGVTTSASEISLIAELARSI